MTPTSTPAAPPPRPSLDDLLTRRRMQDGRVQFTLDPAWQQGRTLYGGLVAALAAQAMRDCTGLDWPLRALQTSFVGPAGSEIVVEVRLLRRGRHAAQVQAVVLNGTETGESAEVKETAAVLLGVFGEARASRLPVLAPERPAVARAPEALEPLPFVEALSPAFLRHFDLRWADGSLPFTGAGGWLHRIHLRLREPGHAPAELLTVLMADMPPSPLLGHLTGPAPASSVSWELELPAASGSQPADPAGWFRADTETLAAAEGYSSQQTRLWRPDGSLAAIGYQTVAVYA